jgi:hypothetical protein
MTRTLESIAGLVGVGLVAAFVAAMIALQREPPSQMLTYRNLSARIPPHTRPANTGPRYVDVPPGYTATLFLSPVTGGLYLEWPGGSQVTALGTGYNDGYVDWDLVRDPAGNEGWMAAPYLSEQYTAARTPSPRDADYLSDVHWEGPIALCVNPAGGPAGLDGDAFVGLVETGIQRWQDAVQGRLPLTSNGRCDSSPDARGDGINTIGWTEDMGLVIAAQTWPNADQGVVSEMDVRLSRGYFTRLLIHNPSKQLEPCVLSTVVHELGHVLGLDHPRAKALPSSMRAVGAARCDKAQPTDFDAANLLRRYAPDDALAAP